MTARGKSLLIIGYGNPARGDDGIGPALARSCAALAHPRVHVDIDYQLSVEHALDATKHDLVIFIDAMIGQPVPFLFQPVDPDAAQELGSHSVSPSAVMRLARDLYGGRSCGFVLGISGAVFGEIDECLSDAGEANLVAATSFLEEFLKSEVDPCIALQSKSRADA